mmetsp:Transcript_18278/g.37022  ORF Transcript_18278/g.37022 Transcript_18278/m.37022 type:complete len:184 (+) Transcript_18278:1535-2086(+)
MGRVMRLIEKGLKRRPVQRIAKGEEARKYVGTFWEPEDFRELPDRIRVLVDECRELEKKQIERVKGTGWHCGRCIDKQGCRELGVPEELVEEWTEGVRFDVSPDLRPYSKGPYSNIYQDLATLEMACREFNKLLMWLIPVMFIPWIESRTTVVTKDSPMEVGGKKYRTCVDLTDSGLNAALRQ